MLTLQVKIDGAALRGISWFSGVAESVLRHRRIVADYGVPPNPPYVD
jgi:hypothetical protein